MLTTMHWLPNRRAALRDELGIAYRGRVDRHLVGAGVEQGPDVVEGTDAAADRHRHEADLRRPADDIEDDRPILVAGGDVEKDQLVGPLLFVTGGDLDRIARIAQVQEVRPLDHAATVRRPGRG